MQHVGNYAPLLKACSKIQFVNPSIDSLFSKKVGKVLDSVFLEQAGSKNMVEDGSPKLIIFFELVILHTSSSSFGGFRRLSSNHPVSGANC